MLRYLSLFILASVVFVVSNGTVDVTLYPSYTTENYVNIIKKVYLKKNVLQNGHIRYTLGKRVLGEKLVNFKNDGEEWFTPQDVEFNLKYTNYWKKITYVEVLVEQTSNIGVGFIVDGGIGNITISIAIEAEKTNRFIYRSRIYGI